MKVLYLSQDYTIHDHRFLAKLAESEHQIMFLRLEQAEPAKEWLPLPARIFSIRWRKNLTAGRRPEHVLELMDDFESILNEVRPDLVHAGPVQSCGFMTALSGFRPFLLMSWGSDILIDSERSDTWRWVTRFTLRQSDMLLCDCQSVRRKVQQLVPTYDDERIVEFPWGVDLTRFTRGDTSSELRKRLGWQDSFIVVFTRSWEQVYGVDVALRAFHLAYLQNPKLRLFLLGNGSLSVDVNQFIAEHGLDNVIYRPGRVPNHCLVEYLRAADLYLSCAYSDGTSVSLLEAMAVQLPVIVTDTQSNREWIIPGNNGWLAEVGNPQDFAVRILQAISAGQQELSRISAHNRKVVEARANWDRNFPKLLDAYHTIEAKYDREDIDAYRWQVPRNRLWFDRQASST